VIHDRNPQSANLQARVNEASLKGKAAKGILQSRPGSLGREKDIISSFSNGANRLMSSLPQLAHFPLSLLSLFIKSPLDLFLYVCPFLCPFLCLFLCWIYFSNGASSSPSPLAPASSGTPCTHTAAVPAIGEFETIK
jgi:hypothetical protein